MTRTYLQEKIGDPDLFTGRRKDLAYCLNWVERTKPQISKSTALLSRRKTGKSALLQRLYNLTFEKNDRVVPFYFEIQEGDQWIVDFSIDFFLTFVHQYLAFKTRNLDYMPEFSDGSFETAHKIAQREGLEQVAKTINRMRVFAESQQHDLLWNVARDAPRHIATYYSDRVVQLIDEFQFINRYIFRDRACTHRISNLAGTYLHTAEYRNAPLMVSGSWVGWLIDDLQKMLPSRFKFRPLEDLPFEEAVEMILKYAHFDGVPITAQTAYLMAELTEGSPFYISALMRSDFEDKDLTTEAGLLATLDFEVSNRRGEINSTWMEYVASAISRINDTNGKRIVLYLCQHRDREVSRKELQDRLSLTLNEQELERRLRALAYSDIIEHGRSNFYYRGVRDNIFDKVFRSHYADDIQAFDPQEITAEYQAQFKTWKQKYQALSGEYNYFKGKFAEYQIINQLHYHAYKQPTFYRGLIENLAEDFEFVRYKSVWSYTASPIYQRDLQVDLLARANTADDYSIIGEVKNRQTTKFSVAEAEQFARKAETLIELEQIGKAQRFVFCKAGFHANTLAYFRVHGIAWSDDGRWLVQV